MAQYRLRHQYFSPSMDTSEHFDITREFGDYEAVTQYCLENTDWQDTVREMIETTDYTKTEFYFESDLEIIEFAPIGEDERRVAKTDYRLQWRDWKGIESEHRIRIYDGQTEKTIVLMTELSDATGVSVTNGCDTIATLVCAEHRLDRSQVIFIEHYERKHKDDFALVTFSWNSRENRFCTPCWQFLGQTEATAICGEILRE